MNAQVTKLGFELKVVLEQEIALLDSLLEVMQSEREMLVRFQPNQLLEHNKRKELLILQHSYLEKNRAEISAQLAAEMKFDGAEPFLREIAEFIGGELGQSLTDLRSKLNALVDSITELNIINKKLIDFSIKSVKGSVAFLKSKFFNSKTYSASGTINQEVDGLSSINSRV